MKGQSNSVIAGSPRNSFRASVLRSVVGVEHCLGDGAYKLTDLRQTPTLTTLEKGSQTAGDKLHGRKGNSPDRQLRSQKHDKEGNDVGLPKQPGGWLRSSHHLKSA